MVEHEHDYYQLLGIQRGADEAAIKAAYRRLAKECHPDTKNGCKESEAQFKAINEAYDVLKDPQKRAAYDRFGKSAFQNGGGPSSRRGRSERSCPAQRARSRRALRTMCCRSPSPTSCRAGGPSRRRRRSDPAGD